MKKEPNYTSGSKYPVTKLLAESETRTPVQIRRELIGELRGFFPGVTENEQAGNAIEKALLIGVAYGSGGQRGAGSAVGILGIPPRYVKAIIDILEGK